MFKIWDSVLRTSGSPVHVLSSDRDFRKAAVLTTIPPTHMWDRDFKESLCSQCGEWIGGARELMQRGHWETVTVVRCRYSLSLNQVGAKRKGQIGEILGQ